MTNKIQEIFKENGNKSLTELEIIHEYNKKLNSNINTIPLNTSVSKKYLVNIESFFSHILQGKWFIENDLWLFTLRKVRYVIIQ